MSVSMDPSRSATPSNPQKEPDNPQTTTNSVTENEDNENDPIIASYDVYLTESDISRYVLQYIDRPTNYPPYNDYHGQKPTGLRLKPKTGLVEVDIPINTRENYDVKKGLRYGDALRKSRSAREGGAYGMAGGFSSSSNTGGSSSNTGKGKVKEDVSMDSSGGEGDENVLLKVQTLGGRIRGMEKGDPVYMLAAFREEKLHLSPVTAVVQVHPQLHHLDAMDELPKGRGGKGRKEGDEERGGENEARAIDVKIKAAEDREGAVAGNVELLKKMQDEQWTTYDWVDAETEESWAIYDTYMMHQEVDGLPQLESAINSEDYLDRMSAPRIDPARPEMTGWAMKQNRKKQRKGAETSESSTEEG